MYTTYISLSIYISNITYVYMYTYIYIYVVCCMIYIYIYIYIYPSGRSQLPRARSSTTPSVLRAPMSPDRRS